MELHPFLEPGIAPRDCLWYVLSTTGDAPVLRVGHACVQVGTTSSSNGKLYVIGGANPSGTFAEVFYLDLDVFSWNRCDVTGFAGRYEHTAFAIDSEPTNIYIFGGADSEGNRSDVQIYDTVNNTFQLVKTSGSPPQPRTFHNGICIDDKLIVYSGGEQGAEPVSDRKVHIFNVKERRWSVLDARGDPPKPRQGHLMAAVGNRLFLHGGMSGITFFDDLHVLDLSKNSWFSMKVKSVRPSGRAAHGGFVVDTSLYIFGGMNQNGALDDMFKLCTQSMEWTKITPNGPPPANRLDFAACTVKFRVADIDHVRKGQSAASVVDQSLSSCTKETSLKIVSSDESSGDLLSGANIVDLNMASYTVETGTEGDHDPRQCVLRKQPEPPVERDHECQGLCSAVSECHLGESGELCQLSNEPEAATCSQRATLSEIGQLYHLAFVHGGMDTGGIIFDDNLVMRLPEDSWYSGI